MAVIVMSYSVLARIVTAVVSLLTPYTVPSYAGVLLVVPPLLVWVTVCDTRLMLTWSRIVVGPPPLRPYDTVALTCGPPGIRVGIMLALAPNRFSEAATPAVMATPTIAPGAQLTQSALNW
jgi:hypothetical protein